MKRIAFLILICIITSCDKNERSSIPLFPVDIELDLNFSDKELIPLYGYKVINKEQRPYYKYIGYSGVLVVNGENNTLYAYDLCCPHEAERTIIIEPTEYGTAKCHTCGTVYDTKYGSGMPESGPSKYTLLKYNVISKGNNLYFIWQY